MKTTIYVIRHGHSLGNLNATFTGHIDVELSELGEKQAEHLVEYFKDKKIDAIYSSDLTRTIQTISGVSKDKNLPINKEVSFREIYAGKWEGVKYKDIEVLYPDEYYKWKNDISKCHPTDGESVKDLANRVFNKLTEIAKKELGKSVIITTHATPIKSIISNITFNTYEKMQELTWFPNASICKIEYDGEKFEIFDIAKDPMLSNDIANDSTGKNIEELKQYLKAIIQQYNNRLIENRLIVKKN